jgi:Ca2+-binding EF-hand superfamily protein
MLRKDKRRLNPKIEIEKRITEAFLVFDTQANRQADVREIGTIVRSLGLVPTEAEVRSNRSIGSFLDQRCSG